MPRHTTTKRIHIIGRPGNGKTTLARQLSKHLNVPHYDLDTIAYEPGSWRKIALDGRIELIQRIMAQPGWVTEGGFLWWTESLLEAADLVVWLDLPFYVSSWRIIKRHVQLSWAGTNPHPGTGKLLRFLLHVTKRHFAVRPLVPKAPDDDAATTRIATVHFLRGYSSKIIHCTSPADVVKFKGEFLNVVGDGS